MFLTNIGPAGALFDYGLLGIFCGIFALVIVFMGRQFFFLHRKNEDRLKEIENDLQKYLAEDRAAIIETLKDSKEVLKDCKEALRNNNRVTEKIIRILENTKL
jgi:regulatory protein YycI of two-component signal transduction system YycFG